MSKECRSQLYVMRYYRFIFDVLESKDPSRPVTKFFQLFMMSLITLNVLAVILETVQSISDEYGTFLYYFEIVSVIVFTIEYLGRLVTCTSDSNFSRPIVGRLRFALTFFMIIDLLAILPFYLPLLFALDLRFIRAIRLIRIFRVLKFGRYSTSLRLMLSVFREKKEELIISVFIVVLLLILSSSLMYYIEHEVQPEIFSSIPATMWWGISTITTVGYGDMYPITPLGKILGAIISLLGIAMFALPTGILASGFTDIFRRRQESKMDSEQR